MDNKKLANIIGLFCIRQIFYFYLPDECAIWDACDDGILLESDNRHRIWRSDVMQEIGRAALSVKVSWQ